MKYVKMLGMLAMAAAALMAFAGTASADTATSTGVTYTGTIHAVSEKHVILHSENAPTPFTLECNGTVHGTITSHGPGLPVSGHISSLVFNECTNGVTVVVTETGTLSATATEKGNAKLTSSGAKVEVHVPLGFKCVYTTANTSVGELTGGSTPTLDINSSTINRTGGSAFCGTGGFWTGSYTITTPHDLTIDKT